MAVRQFRLCRSVRMVATLGAVCFLVNYARINNVQPWLLIIPKNQYGPDCPSFRAPDQIDCPNVLAQKESSLKAAKSWATNKSHIQWTTQQFDNMMTSCESLLEGVCLPTRPLSHEEEKYPLAFVFLVHNEREAVLSLLQALYFPQNLYCFTFDLDASREIKTLVHLLFKCLPNVLLPPEQIKVTWGFYSVLQSAMNCLHELTHRASHNEWKYVQIISGNDIPIRTNLEMVRIFKIFNGAQDVELTKGQMYRIDSKIKKGHKIPGNLTFYKGSFASGLSREFVEFVLKDKLVQEYYKFLDGTQFPDEGLWSTVVHNPQLKAPGYFPGSCLKQNGTKRTAKLSISRFQIWPDSKDKHCGGRWIRGSCSLGQTDLPSIISAKEIMAHKIDYFLDNVVHVCVKEWVQNRTYKLSNASVDYTPYLNLPAVKYHSLTDKSQYHC